MSDTYESAVEIRDAINDLKNELRDRLKETTLHISDVARLLHAQNLLIEKTNEWLDGIHSVAFDSLEEKLKKGGRS